MKQTIFTPAELCLPKDRSAASMERWSVVACDQYTSDRAYWNRVDALVGDAPSTLRIILPELYLNDADKEERIAAIGRTMEAYEQTVLERFPDAMLYLERTMKNGTVRRGVVGAVDLEAYDYNKGSVSAVRATEGTVLSRIPPRVQIRKNAVLEAPHVMLLIDDPEDRVLSAAARAKTHTEAVYDFSLMQNGGHIAGWMLDGTEKADVDDAMAALGCRETFQRRYGAGREPLVIAVGDGNHSLATAKACYEALKAEIGEDAARRHPARWALAEVVNLHDSALEFEPIYRVLFGTTRDALRSAMKAYYPAMQEGDAEGHRFVMLDRTGEETLCVPDPAAQLPVGTLQTFLDAYLAEHPEVVCDYIHGVDAVRSLAAEENTVGFLFDGMKKDDLFRTVIYDGALPRKTFSMGEADEKRYYLECRSIRI